MQSTENQKQSSLSSGVSDVLEIDLQRVLQILKRHWLPGVGVFTVLSLLILFAIVRAKPTYKASGTVLVEKPRNEALLGLGINAGDLDSLQGAGAVVTQTELIKSVPLVQQTIDDLGLTSKDGSPLTVDEFLKKIRVESVPRADVLKITYRAKDASEAARVVNTIMKAYVDDNLEINRVEVKAARGFIEEQLPRVEQDVRKYEQAVRRFNETNRIVSLEDESRAAIDMTTTLNKNLADISTKLSGASARSQALRQRISIDPQQAIASVNLSQSSGVQAVLNRYQDLQRQLTEQLTRYRPDHPSVQQLQRQVDAASNLLQQRVSEVVENQVISTEGSKLQLGEFETKLITDFVNAEFQRIDLLNQYNQLSAIQAQQQSRISKLPRLRTEQSELERRLSAAQNTYQTLLTKLQEIRVAEQQTIANARVISPAITPEKPTLLTSTTGRLALSTVGLLVSAGLGVAAAFVSHLLDRKLRSIADAKDIFGYPVLGIIPHYGEGTLEQMTQNLSKAFQEAFASLPVQNSKVIVRDSPRSPASAAFQMLQTNIKYLSSDRKARVIVVTSSVPREGKSETAANLAATLAQVGRRVLLVDVDLRRPRQHKVWDTISTSSGLSNLLVGEQELSQITQAVMPNLTLIPAGTIPPNPVALIDSEHMASLVQQFRNEYDYVILDTPPLAGIADATILGKMADGVLLVTRPGVCTLASARAAKDFLEQGEQNVLGLVVNDVNSLNEPDSYFYGAHYYYHYGEDPNMQYDREDNSLDVNGVTSSINRN